MISAQNTAPILTAKVDPNSTYFRTAPNDLIQGAVVADFIGGELALDRVAVVSDGTVYSEEIVSVFERKVGSYGVSELQSFKVDRASDLTAIATSFVRGGFQGVYMPVNSPVCENLMDAIAATPGSTGLEVVTSDACVVNSAVPSATKVRAFGSGPDVTALLRKPFYDTEYRSAYRSTFGREPLSLWNTSAFDAANLMFNAIERSALKQGDGSILIPRRALTEMMRTVNGYNGVSNKLACASTGDCVQSATIGIFQAPAWPVGGEAQSARPVFSKAGSLASAIRGD